MSDKTWNTPDLLNFCSADVIANADVYVASLKNKIDRILFIRDRFILAENMTLKTGSDQFIKTQLEVEIFIESVASNLHSLADVLAQIINEIVLKPLLPTTEAISIEKVDLNKVTTQLAKINLNPVKLRYVTNIINNITNLSNSAEFLYISGFVNTIKHRRLLNTTFRLKIDCGSLIDLGFKLDPFDYKGNSFPETSCRDIVMDYREKIIDFIVDIGNSVNDYCRVNSI